MKTYEAKTLPKRLNIKKHSTHRRWWILLGVLSLVALLLTLVITVR